MTLYRIATPRTDLVWRGTEAAHLRQIVVYKETKKRTPTEEPVFDIFKIFSFFTRARLKKEGTDAQMADLKNRIDQKIPLEDQYCALTANQSFSEEAFASDIIEKTQSKDSEVQYCTQNDPQMERIFKTFSEFHEFKN